VIEYFVNYCVVGLFWAGFLRLRYVHAGDAMRPANWLVILAFWPILMLAFIQGCLFGPDKR
jgi:hypothetical protein